MAKEKKNGFWSWLFNNKKSSCCNFKFEEIREEANNENKDQQDQSNKISCCGGDNKAKSKGNCCGNN